MLEASTARAIPIALPEGALLNLAAAFPERYPVLLDSAAQGNLSQYTILAALPRGALWLDAAGRLHRSGDVVKLDGETDFLAALDAAWRAAAQDAVPRAAARSPASLPPSAGLPFTGGWMVYLGYELAAQIEPRLQACLPASARADTRPVALALRIPAALVQDAAGQGWLLAESGVSEAELARIREDLADVGQGRPQTPRGAAALVMADEDPQRYIARVERAKEYIRAGDIYQANLSRRWCAQLPAALGAADLYARLRRANPAPFAALAQFGDFRVLSSSPERLLRIREGRAETRPIAGTHPRGATTAEDYALAQALLAHPKERAEHVMLIDLARNDLGRVCAGGSVRVDERMAVETYAHVHHIVSNVSGVLRDGVSPAQALRAVFPGGTITGVPKLRCMQIIAELEDTPRGPYTGSLGYLNHDGSGDFNILIRTLSLHGDALEFRAGAGIVADSDPARELAETRAKARGLLLALQ
jgi:anthranilate synthase component 1